MRKVSIATVVLLALTLGAGVCVGEAAGVTGKDEPTLAEFSLGKANKYVHNGAVEWTKNRKCVSCHITGTYMTTRPALTPFLGKPSDEMRTFFVERLRASQKESKKKLLASVRPTETAYIAAGLAEWDAHVTETISPQTDEALKLMFSLQLKNGSWGNVAHTPPTESSRYHAATVAAMAAATAPKWLEQVQDKELLAGFDKVKRYLRTTEPPHDFGRLLLLWTATRIPDLLDADKTGALIDMVRKHQRTDGGWSIRTFAAPEEWGSGNRAEKLRAEPGYENPPSDGYQTGLVVTVLRDAGVSASDPHLQRAVKWLLTNQCESGHWWTRSLNKDAYNRATSYSGSCYALLALAKCNALPPDPLDTIRSFVERERKSHKEATALAAEAADKGITRINCGIELAYTDPQSNGWFADGTYEGGGFGNIDGRMVHRGPIEITGTDNSEIYRSELWGQKSCHITLPNGTYLVRLHWAETYGANRKFDVTIEGKALLKDFNPLGEAGAKNKAFFREFTIDVADGVLDIEFPCEKGGPPMINGIEVIRK